MKSSSLDSFIEHMNAKLTEFAVKCRSYVEPDQYNRLLCGFQPCQLFDYYGLNPDLSNAAGLFTLVPRFVKQDASYYHILLAFLLGSNRENMGKVTLYLDSYISDEFYNTVLHELLVNTKFSQVDSLLDSCRDIDIPLKCILKTDKNGRTPLDIAIMLDVTPVDIQHRLLDLYVNQMLDCADSTTTSQHTASVYLTRLINSLIVAYQYKNYELLTHVESVYPQLYAALERVIQKNNIDFLKADAYANCLQSVCMSPTQSRSDRNESSLTIPIYNHDEIVDSLLVCIHNNHLRFAQSSLKTQFYVEIPLLPSLLSKAKWKTLDAAAAPWDPLCKAGAKTLLATKSNHRELYRFLNLTSTTERCSKITGRITLVKHIFDKYLEKAFTREEITMIKNPSLPWAVEDLSLMTGYLSRDPYVFTPSSTLSQHYSILTPSQKSSIKQSNPFYNDAVLLSTVVPMYSEIILRNMTNDRYNGLRATSGLLTSTGCIHVTLQRNSQSLVVNCSNCQLCDPSLVHDPSMQNSINQLGIFALQTPVILTGLKNNNYNNKKAVVVSHVNDKGRIAVELDESSTRILVKPESCRKMC